MQTKISALEKKKTLGDEREVRTLKGEVFTQRALIRKLNFEKIQRRLFILKNYYGSSKNWPQILSYSIYQEVGNLCSLSLNLWACGSLDSWNITNIMLCDF